MASPRVFVSSTCYDLAEVRDGLFDFITSFGFDPALSDRGDVFYHPDIHTHDSCLNEVGNCQLFVLIIGGRFGGSYDADTTKSIVNAEYAAAREQKIPVFTFIKKNVYSDHHVYLKNKSNPSVKDIVFPSIENMQHAEKIFGFIDDVRLAPVNNGVFSFEFTRDLTSLLRKQWAGMLYDFLEERTSSNQLKVTTNLLKSISIAGEKVEELVKSLYRHVDSAGAEAKIVSVEKRAVAREFFDEAFKTWIITKSDHVQKEMDGDVVDALITMPRTDKWYEYIANAIGGVIEEQKWENTLVYKVMKWGHFGQKVDCPDDPSDVTSVWSRKQQERFTIVSEMEDDELKSILSELEFLKSG